MKQPEPANQFWLPSTTEAVKDYLEADTTEERNRIYTLHLHEPFTHLSRQALYSVGVPITEDYIQDITIHLMVNVLPKCKIDRVQTFLQYAFVSAKRHAINNMYLKDIKKQYIVNYTDLDIDMEGYSTAELLTQRRDTHIEIIGRLDTMIQDQRIVNKTNTIFLLLLRQYLIDNQFIPTGFKTYVTKTMNIKSSTFAGIASRLRIGIKLFKDEDM